MPVPKVTHRHDYVEYAYFNEYDFWYRLDGPAVTIDRGISFVSYWYVNGYCVDTEIREWAEEMNIDLENLTEEDKILIAMAWSDYQE